MSLMAIQINYDEGYLDENDLYDLVERGDITPEDYEDITGLEYKY